MGRPRLRIHREVRGLLDRRFLRAGHLPTLLAAFLYFDTSFMAWVMLGPLAVQIAADLGLSAAQQGFLVALPVLSGALLRVAAGVLVDRLGPRRTGLVGQVAVIAGLLAAWRAGVTSYAGTLGVGAVLGVAGASFAVALPLASRWYPARYQGLALGIAGAGNSGTVFAALLAPGLAERLGWQNVLGLAAIPLTLALLVYAFAAKDAPGARPPRRSWKAHLAVLEAGDAWWFMFFYAVTFGGFVGLASSLSLYFHGEHGLDPVRAGYFTAACVFAGSLVRPLGGALADRIGGIRALSFLYAVAAGMLLAAGLWPQSALGALGLIGAAMLAFGMGNGAVFQLVPQRFGREIGVVTGLVGMAGGVGGFYLASSLGLSREYTGSYDAGLLLFAALPAAALVALGGVRQRWRATWGAPGSAAARI